MRRVVPRDILERLVTGDMVVHIDHGIARYEQMLRRGEAGQERDYLELSFAAGDRIFVPVEQINRVSRYSGGDNPQLSRLGGTDWLRTKQRVRKAVNDLAEELLDLYAKREAAAGFAYAVDTPWQAEMEASFPYEETPDQLRAAIEVKVDMEARKPMDRLVVGDVGYGKTEVALRAAFKATQDGKQVAVLVPTTVLAGQHFTTFSQRFAAFPITVKLLSRFVGAKEQEATVAGLASGGVDIVIGTHRLLSKDVAFKDLGLVVVDEEQRFGVAAKERLKQLRSAVDVLTLSATPIPRTLNLALAGIRDLSVIETPPEDRLPIQTRVAEASAGLVRDAILRELDRGGQVFYVHNRVETIEAQAEQLRRLLPGARIVVGHGQMGEGALEKVMLTFADGAADVLVCTTIIESGLDIPNANTIVIDRADTLGLAQLYQLRGRVGRSSRRAYAYLLYRRRERMSEEARKRLQAIFNASELGAGFQIALADLEIRGAGNILGGEQSGFMASVGFDLYSRLLADAVEEAKARREDREPVREVPQAVVDLPVEAHLPDTYVPEEAQKLELYRRLARARSAGDLAAFRQEVTDRYGPMPAPVLRLVEVAELRLAAEGAGVASLAREEGWLVVRFGAGLSRATAMQLLSPSSGAPLPGVRAGDMTFASNQVRIRLPKDALKGWVLTQAVVSRLVAAARREHPSEVTLGVAGARSRPQTRTGNGAVRLLCHESATLTSTPRREAQTRGPTPGRRDHAEPMARPTRSGVPGSDSMRRSLGASAVLVARAVDHPSGARGSCGRDRLALQRDNPSHLRLDRRDALGRCRGARRPLRRTPRHHQRPGRAGLAPGAVPGPVPVDRHERPRPRGHLGLVQQDPGQVHGLAGHPTRRLEGLRPARRGRCGAVLPGGSADGMGHHLGPLAQQGHHRGARQAEVARSRHAGRRRARRAGERGRCRRRLRGRRLGMGPGQPTAGRHRAHPRDANGHHGGPDRGLARPRGGLPPGPVRLRHGRRHLRLQRGPAPADLVQASRTRSGPRVATSRRASGSRSTESPRQLACFPL